MTVVYDVIWSKSAFTDFERIIRYITQDNPSQASAIFKNIKERASSLRSFPERGRVVPELEAQGILSYRELVIPPWRIIYRTAEKSVFVLAIVDSRRNIEDILLQKLTDSDI